MTWDDVGRIACELPAVEASASYGTPAYKIRKALLVRLTEDGASIVLFRDFDEKELLLEAAPEVFFQTDHYRKWSIESPPCSARLARRPARGRTRVASYERTCERRVR